MRQRDVILGREEAFHQREKTVEGERFVQERGAKVKHM
jgi:hypothetical protein